MSYRPTSNIRLEILDQVLPNYPSAANMPTEHDTPGTLYKSMDSRTGDIYLITNPVSWRAAKALDGTTTRFRPRPRLVLTYANAIKEAANTTVEDREAGEKPKRLL